MSFNQKSNMVSFMTPACAKPTCRRRFLTEKALFTLTSQVQDPRAWRPRSRHRCSPRLGAAGRKPTLAFISLPEPASSEGGPPALKLGPKGREATLGQSHSELLHIMAAAAPRPSAPAARASPPASGSHSGEPSASSVRSLKIRSEGQTGASPLGQPDLHRPSSGVWTRNRLRMPRNRCC